MSEKPLRAVKTEWVDSAQAASAWQWLEDMDTPSVTRCVSIGFLVQETPHVKRLAISIAGEAKATQASGIISIPTKSIVKMTTLKGVVAKW